QYSTVHRWAFFFSSRRRHTRFSRDWSSDVCSSDLAKLRDFGFDEVHENIAGTGVVGLLQGRGKGNRRVGLRADMDALPIEETSRSEERRVGKEGSSGRWAAEEKEQDDEERHDDTGN